MDVTSFVSLYTSHNPYLALDNKTTKDNHGANRSPTRHAQCVVSLIVHKPQSAIGLVGIMVSKPKGGVDNEAVVADHMAGQRDVLRP